MTGSSWPFAGGLREVAAELVEDLGVAALLVAFLRAGADACGRALAAAASAAGAAAGRTGRTLVAGEQLDDLLAHAGQVGAELDEHLCGNALTLADEAEQDVLGADVVVAELQRFTQRQLEDLLRTRREGDVARRRRAALTDDLFDLATHGLEADAERFERFRGDALTLVDEAEQDVLGADVAVIEQPGFFLREHDDSSRPIGKAFEHVASLSVQEFCLNPIGALSLRPVVSPSGAGQESRPQREYRHDGPHS